MKKLNYKHFLVLLVFFAFKNTLFSQDVRPFNALSVAESRTIVPLKGFAWEKVKFFKTSRTELLKNLSTAPKESSTFRANNSNFLIELPLPDGTTAAFKLVETNLLSPETALLFPNIKTYDGEEIDHPLNKATFTVSSLGLNGVMVKNGQKFYIRPYQLEGSDEHIIFESKDETVPNEVHCGVNAESMGNGVEQELNEARAAGDCQLRTYRIVVAATGEYVTWAGSQANAATQITATINNVKLVYLREAAISFTLILNNALLYTNAATDPFADGANATSGADLAACHAAITTVIGTPNFDLGHVFSNGWNGGLASTPSVCNSTNKGNAQSGLKTSTFPSGPTGSIMESTVLHEVAHQFSVSHTMSSQGGGCTGNVALATAVETGGGSTLMAYAGVCTGNAYQSQSDQYFHGVSLNTLTTYAVSQSTCGTLSALSNTQPSLTLVGTSYTIPVGTPFLISGTGLDIDGDALTYTFEQKDAILAATTSNPSATATNGPNFRSFPPSSSNSRFFPSLSTILSGANGSTFEVLPTVARTMNFVSVVRDNRSGGGCAKDVSMTVTTAGSTPFVITSQNSATSLTANGANTFTVTWDVSGTAAAPVNCANVKISFSTDGGQTFPYDLASSTANDGTELFVVPNFPTTAGRIKVEGVGNIFFDINDAPITIGSAAGCIASGSTIIPTTPVFGTIYNASLDLALAPQFASVFTQPIAGSITSSDPTSSLTVLSSGSCISYGNVVSYDTYSFQVNAAGTYIFSRGGTGSSLTLNLYSTSFNPSSTCTNFITSSSSNSGGPTTIGGSVSSTLLPGNTYVLVVISFNNATPTPALPAAYSISVTKPAGGEIYNVPGVPNPGVSYNYTYIMVNTATNNIAAINASSDLSALVVGQYNVYGLSYINTVSAGTLNAYIGGSFSVLQSAVSAGTICANLSGNSVPVTINCASNPAVTITNNNGLTIGCSPSSTILTASATGAASYIWSNGTTASTLTATSGGTYQVTVTDASGCKGISSAAVVFTTATPIIAISSTNGLDMSCSVTSTTLNATGAATYLWNGGSVSSSKLVSSVGIHSVTATGSNGCKAVKKIGISSDLAIGSTISPTTAVSANLNAAALDLTLSPVYATATTLPIVGQIASTDPTTFLAVNNTTQTGCSSFGNVPVYKSFSFQVNKSGEYTFSRGATGPGLTLNLYSNSYNTASPCTNFIFSSSTFDGTYVNTENTVMAALTQGITYVLVVTTLNGAPAAGSPNAFSIDVTAPSGGILYNAPGTVPPSANYSYTYVITKVGGNVAAINTSSDLSGINVAGSYNVYGLSYLSSISAATLNAFIGSSFATLQAAISGNTLCAQLSSNSTPVTITCASGPASSILPANPAVCGSSSITLTANAGATYNWGSNTGSATSPSVSVAPGTYNVTVTGSNGCTTALSSTVISKTFMTTSTVNTYTLTEDCTTSGWTAYNNGNDLMFAIEWQPTGSAYNNAPAKAAATVSLVLDASNGSATNATDATFTMKRYWNVSLSGGQTLAGPVNVRFFYTAAEKTATDAAAAAYAATISKPVEAGKWFKTTSVQFNPATGLNPVSVANNPIALTDVNSAAALIDGNLYAQFNGVASFSGGTYATGVGLGTPLPIHLLSFNGKKLDQAIALDWKTEDERNVAFFTLEKSLDGINFSAIGKIMPKTSRNYYFLDENPLIGDNYYRLKVVDKDGSERYEGGVIVVKFLKNNSFVVYPNPTNGKITIGLESDENKESMLRVFNVLGEMLATFSSNLVKGNNEISIDLQHLPSGTYLLDIDQLQKQTLIIR